MFDDVKDPGGMVYSISWHNCVLNLQSLLTCIVIELRLLRFKKKGVAGLTLAALLTALSNHSYPTRGRMH